MKRIGYENLQKACEDMGIIPSTEKNYFAEAGKRVTRHNKETSRERHDRIVHAIIASKKAENEG